MNESLLINAEINLINNAFERKNNLFTKGNVLRNEPQNLTKVLDQIMTNQHYIQMMLLAHNIHANNLSNLIEKINNVHYDKELERYICE